MTIKIIAKTTKGKEFFYNANSAYKVSANSAEKILSVLNSVRWNLSDNQVWHVYEITEFDTAYTIARYQKFTIRKGIVKAVYEN